MAGRIDYGIRLTRQGGSRIRLAITDDKRRQTNDVNVTPAFTLELAEHLHQMAITSFLCDMLGGFLVSDLEYTPERAGELQNKFLIYVLKYMQEMREGGSQDQEGEEDAST